VPRAVFFTRMTGNKVENRDRNHDFRIKPELGEGESVKEDRRIELAGTSPTIREGSIKLQKFKLRGIMRRLNIACAQYQGRRREHS